jgi:oxepin-CoA hydrolase/3-oxo-5,6-dehydrosuberyl-CoA semialdehyde dehydrogenase
LFGIGGRSGLFIHENSLMKIKSYVSGAWVPGSGEGRQVRNAVSGEPLCTVDSGGIDFAAVLRHGREVGGPALRRLTLHERAALLKAVAKHLLEKKEALYDLSACTGATRADSRVDIEGGIGTFFSYASLARREFNDEPFIVEGPVEPLSRGGTFVGRHILVPKLGVSVHINAFNFPCWGMLEKIAPSLIAGVPVIVKPGSLTCYVTEAVVKEIIDCNLLPEGSLQLICGGIGDLFDHLGEQDTVTFTGSAGTGRKLRTHPNIIEHSVPFNMEADSLNCAVLGESVAVNAPEFDLFIEEVVREMTAKAGQKCTAIRRIIVPQSKTDDVISALKERLARVRVGDPAVEGVTMGPLAGLSQREEVERQIEKLKQSSEVICGGNREFEVTGADMEKGAFVPPTLLYCREPLEAREPHAVEAFGPVATVLPYRDRDEAVRIAALGKGSLVGSAFTHDDAEAAALVLGCAPYHGRLLVLNRDCAKESTGHGSPLPALVHGGPGRAGGGEELGGARAVKHYMQRTAVQGSPTTLMALTRQYSTGARTTPATVHPFRKYFEDLEIGESLLTGKRTVTEDDIRQFGDLTGDHFYAHFDEEAARASLFGKRVAHGYFVISAAAGLFVDPAPGPVLANYGLDNLRFRVPVGIGDTLQVRLTVKQKIKKEKRPEEERATGVVVWEVQVWNQDNQDIAVYDILTLVERREGTEGKG